MQEIEIWKPAPGCDDLYLISNHGRVMSLDYKHTGIHKIIKPRKRGRYLSFHRNNRGKDIPIHRLVALAFIPNPNNLPCVNHKDENKRNNFVWVNEDGSVDLEKSNLEWCDHQYNNTYGNRLNKMADTRKNRTAKSHFGIVFQYTISGELVATFKSTVTASKATGIERSSINRCALGQQKTAGGYKWGYERTEHPNLLNYEHSDTTKDKV